MASDVDVQNAVITYLVHNKVTGGHKKQVQTVIREASIASHNEGKAKELIDEMAKNPDAPIQRYGGGHRENIHLTSMEAGVAFLKEHGGDVPWDWE